MTRTQKIEAEYVRLYFLLNAYPNNLVYKDDYRYFREKLEKIYREEGQISGKCANLYRTLCRMLTIR